MVSRIVVVGRSPPSSLYSAQSVARDQGGQHNNQLAQAAGHADGFARGGGGGIKPLHPAVTTRLIAFDTRGNKPPRIQSVDGFRVCEKLRPHLVTLVGKEAFRALLAHALALARAEVATLREVQVKADGTLEMSQEIRAQIHADELFEGGMVLLAQLLGLLVAFIGENLTLGLVRETWPKAPLDNLHLNNENNNATKK